MYRRAEVRRELVCRERATRWFSARWAPLCSEVKREQCRQDYLPPPFLASISCRCVQAGTRSKTTPRERSSAIVSMDSYRAPSSRTSTSFLPPLPLRVSLFAIHSRIYPYGGEGPSSLSSLSSSPFGVPLFGYPYRLLLARAISIHHTCWRDFPSIAFAFAFTSARSSSSFPRLLLSFLPVSTYHSSRLLFLFLPPPPPRPLSSHDSRFMKAGDMG